MTIRSKSTQLLLISYAAFIAMSLSVGVLGVAWVYIEDTFGVTLAALGLLLALRTPGGLVISFFSGSIMSRLGIGPFMLLGSNLLIMGTLGFVLAPAWWVFVLAGVVAGLGASALINGLNAFVAANYSSSRMNWLHACFGLGSTIGPFLVTFIVINKELSWQWVYLTIAAAQGVITLLLMLTLNDWRIGSPGDETEDLVPAKKVSMRDTLSLPIVWISVTLFVVATAVELTTGQFTHTLFVDGRGIDPKIAAQWIGIYWGTFTIGRIVSGLIVDRVNHAHFLRASILGTILGALMLSTNLSELWSFAGLALMGLSLAPMAPTLFSDTPRRVGVEHIANAIGFQNLGAGLGLSIPPWMAGVLADSLGLEIIGPFLMVFAILTFVAHEVLVMRERRVAVVTASP